MSTDAAQTTAAASSHRFAKSWKSPQLPATPAHVAVLKWP
jgi:hypothetical protein